jgi:apolipoprotein N-acyltransferase
VDIESNRSVVSSIFKLLALTLLAAILNSLALIYVNFIASFLAFPLIVYLILQANAKRQVFSSGTLFGVFSSLFLNFWMIPVIRDYAQGGIALAVLCYLASAFVLALFFGTQFYLFSLIRLPEAKRFSLVSNALLMACIWVFFEWIRAECFSAMPWLSYSVGITQGKNLFLIQPAAFGGVYVLSFLILFSAYFVAFSVYRKEWKFLFVPALVLGLQFSGGFLIYKNIKKQTDRSENKFSAALILGALSPETVWNEKSADSLVSHLLSLNKKAIGNRPDLIVWSETVVPWTYAPDDDFLKEIAKETSPWDTQILIGMNSALGTSGSISNSVYLLDSYAKEKGRYDKQDLLTLVEKPLLSSSGSIILPFLAAYNLKMRAGSHKRPLETAWGKAGILLCNESTYPSLVRDRVRQGASFLVNMGNDNWFADCFIGRQHFYNCRLRAVENRKDVLINNNMGMAGLVRASGEIAAEFNGQNSGVQFVELAPNNLSSFPPLVFISFNIFIILLAVFNVLFLNFKSIQTKIQ